MSNQKRMEEIASQFGDKDRISISLGREKIYPNKEVSDATVERLENALRSPESEKGTVRVVQSTPFANKAELIYRSSQNAVDFDPKNIASQLQTNSHAQTPKIAVEQNQAVAQKSEREPGGAIVKACQDKEIIPFPINPTQPKLDEKIQEVLKPIDVNQGSLEQALAAANARIDSLQTQLKDTQKSLEDLSKFVRNDNLKSWAENKVKDITKTSQSIAQQAKTSVMQWVKTKTIQVKEVVHQKVTEVKTAAQDKVNEVLTVAQDKATEVKAATQNKVNEVKTVAHDKVTEVKTLAQDKVTEVKTVAQNKVSEVKEAVQLKGIEFKESIREQANKFLAPVNSKEVEQAAKYIVSEYGDGKSYNKAATHSFQLNDKNELSVARQADGAVVYQKGELTKAANPHDILKLNALPAVVNQIKVTQMQSAQKQQMEVGS